jgi:hypothetical protein
MALDRDLLVIPVLINDAPRPGKQDLPDQLWRLTVYNDIRVRLNDRPGDAIARVCEAIKAKRKAGGVQRWLKPAALAAGLAAVVAAAVMFWPSDSGATGHQAGPTAAADSSALRLAADSTKENERSSGSRTVPETSVATQPVPASTSPGAGSEGTASESPACALDGVQFKQQGMGRDQLLFTAVDGGRRLQASGQLNGHTVSGWFAMSGHSMKVLERPGATILGGQLTLTQGCGSLSGSLSLRSVRTGGTVNVTVNLMDPTKAG